MHNIQKSLALVERFKKLKETYPNISPNLLCRLNGLQRAFIPNFFNNSGDRIELAVFVLGDTPIFAGDQVWWINNHSCYFNKQLLVVGFSDEFYQVTGTKDNILFKAPPNTVNATFTLDNVLKFASLAPASTQSTVKLKTMGGTIGACEFVEIPRVTKSETRSNLFPITDSKGELHWIDSLESASKLGAYMQNITDELICAISNGYEFSIKITDKVGQRERLAFKTQNRN